MFPVSRQWGIRGTISLVDSRPTWVSESDLDKPMVLRRNGGRVAKWPRIIREAFFSRNLSLRWRLSAGPGVAKRSSVEVSGLNFLIVPFIEGLGVEYPELGRLFHDCRFLRRYSNWRRRQRLLAIVTKRKARVMTKTTFRCGNREISVSLSDFICEIVKEFSEMQNMN